MLGGHLEKIAIFILSKKMKKNDFQIILLGMDVENAKEWLAIRILQIGKGYNPFMRKSHEKLENIMKYSKNALTEKRVIRTSFQIEVPFFFLQKAMFM